MNVFNKPMTQPVDMKWQLFVNNLFMAGFLTYGGARRAAERYTEGQVEIRNILNKGDNN